MTIAATQDKVLAEQACAHLRRYFHAALNGIHCDCRRGVLVLRGSVPSYYLKQLAQQIALRTEGVEQVVNQLDVPS
jgi:osmotically-inducible protein OsmY